MPTQVEINRTLAKNVLSIVDVGLTSGLGKPIPGQMCVEAAVCYALGMPHGDKPTCVAPVLRKLKIALNDKAWSSNAARAKGLRRLAIIQLGTDGELDEKAFVTAVAETTIRVIVPIALRAASSMRGNAKYKDSLEGAADRCEKEGSHAATDAAAYTADAAADAADAATDAAYTADAARAAAHAAAHAARAADAADAATDAAYTADAARAAAHAAAHAARAAAHAAARAAYTADAAARAADYAAQDNVLSRFAEGIVQILVSMNVKAAAYLDLAPLE